MDGPPGGDARRASCSVARRSGDPSRVGTGRDDRDVDTTVRGDCQVAFPGSPALAAAGRKSPFIARLFADWPTRSLRKSAPGFLSRRLGAILRGVMDPAPTIA